MVIFLLVFLIYCSLMQLGLASKDGLSAVQLNTEDFPFTTVVDVLSQNVEFSTFLRLVQRDRHIPYLNGLDNFTLLAPVNSAFYLKYEHNKLDIQDYVIHNRVLFSKELEPGFHLYSDGYRYPLLIQVKSHQIYSINGITVVEHDLQPSMQNASVQGLSETIRDVPPLLDVIAGENENNEGDLSLFSRILASFYDVEEPMEKSFSNKTLLLPANSALRDQFNELEIKYLTLPITDERAFPRPNTESNLDQIIKDKMRIFDACLINGLQGGLLNRTEVPTLNGGRHQIMSVDQGATFVLDGISAAKSNVIYENGVLHTFRLLPHLRQGFVFNSEKYLLGLNCSQFVAEVHFRGLSSLINDNSRSLTIFVPEPSNSHNPGFSKYALLYHFTDGQLDLSRLGSDDERRKSELHDSLFCSSNKKLGGHCQRFKLEKVNFKKKEVVLINGREVLNYDHPLTIGNTTIYLTEDELTLPPDFITIVSPLLHCSKSLYYLQNLNLLDLPGNFRGYTILLPCFDSWTNFDLVLDYLERNVTALNGLMKSFMFNGLLYSDTKSTVASLTDLNGQDVHANIEHETNGKDVSLQLNTFDSPIILTEGKDLIYDQGVVHLLKSMSFPKLVQVTLKNLLDTTGSSDFMEFLNAFESFANIINNDEPYSFIVPTARSLLYEDINLNSTTLEQFIKLHIIPGNSTAALINCDEDIETLHGQHLGCHRMASDDFLYLKSGIEKEVRILKKGCTSSDNSACVFLVDRPISLSWLKHEKYSISLPGFALAIGLMLGILFFALLSICVSVACLGKSRKSDYEENENDCSPSDEHTPLMRNGTMNNPPSNDVRDYGCETETGNGPSADQTERGPFANTYSTKSVSTPIAVGPKFFPPTS
ncbi:LAMI_0H09186g1_1 [Lachancea mirantina]|uniref:LAMI_0H09186g1_1 n=1 Tax=Lachancea mirantina TaxID=1230905 RepID=A0A1G4KGC7_9SACH|nr:LAMI_0H09186g1_1 [Lachancea mirantina]